MKIGQPLVRGSRLADRVADHLRDQVLDGSLSAGARLPADRVLAEQYGVSRTVIREAVRTLVGQGLLETAGGSGTYVSRPDPKEVAKSMTMLLRLHHDVASVPYSVVHEVRKVLEIDIAGFAAERADSADIEEIERQFARWLAATDNQEEYIAADVAFHAALASATHNPLFPILYEALFDVMVEVRRLGFPVAGAFRSALAHHERILAAVKAHDAAAARAAMTDHLQESERIMLLGLEIEGTDGS